MIFFFFLLAKIGTALPNFDHTDLTHQYTENNKYRVNGKNYIKNTNTSLTKMYRDSRLVRPERYEYFLVVKVAMYSNGPFLSSKTFTGFFRELLFA